MSTQLHQLKRTDYDWKLKYYSQLQGAKILKVEIFEDDFFTGSDANWPVLIVELADGSRTEIQISQDAEGNGPGFLFGLNRV